MNQPDFSYNLNLTRDYISHWGLKEAVRELVANNIDEHGKIELLGDKSMGILRLTTDHELPLEAFLMGYSAKSTDKPIGQYGEGLKLAMLVLARENRSYVLSSGQYSYAFVFKTAAGFGVSTLHVERYHRIYDGDEYDDFILSEEQAKTCIIVYGVDKSRLDSVYNPAPPNSVIRGSIGLFCQGLLVEPTFHLTMAGVSHAVNLDVSLKGNRDRNYFTNKELMIPVLEKYFEPKVFLNWSTSWSESTIFDKFSKEYKRRVVEAYVREKMPEYADADLTDKILLIPSNNERFQRRENVIIAPYWWLGWWLMTYGERQLLQDLKIDDDDLDDESDDERDARLRKRIRLMLEDLLLSKDLKDFMESMSNYLPRLKEYREDVRDFITELVTAIIYDKDYPAIPESLEDEPEYEQKCDVDLDE